MEERVNTILTKDENKRKVYLQGYDGHSYRALYYFAEDLKELKAQYEAATSEQQRIEIINSIKDDYPEYRDSSKPITFLLQYLGTAYGIRLNCGMSQEDAIAIERNYHELYSTSNEWLQAKLDSAAETGYVEVAYGLRVFCSAISKSILDSKHTPKVVSKHIRTIGNALCQSYGQITVDAGLRFLERVYENNLQDRVSLSMTIHDALYPIWDADDAALTKWVNDNLIECMEDLTELPELMSDIPLVADLEYFSPSWAKCKTLPKFGSLTEIVEALNND